MKRIIMFLSPKSHLYMPACVRSSTAVIYGRKIIMRFAAWALPCLVIGACLSAGCLSSLDKKQHEVVKAFADNNQAFAKVLRAFATAANEMVKKKHDLQRLHLKRDLDDFISLHSDGTTQRMVSLDVAGQKQPILVADFQSAITAYEEKLDAITASEKSWTMVYEPFLDSVDKFARATERVGATEEQIMEAKASAQAFTDSLFTALGGVAAGAGMVAVAP